MSNTITSSRFMKGRQCQKALWLEVFKPELKTPIDPSFLALFEEEQAIKKQAQQLFEQGPSVLFNETVAYHDGLVTVDVLQKTDQGWVLYLIKNSASVKRLQLLELAFHYFVVSQSGRAIHRSVLIHLNKHYTYHSHLDLQKLFVFSNVSDNIQDLQPTITQKYKLMTETLHQTTCPSVDIGLYCDRPYPCPFKSTCWAHIPESSVFNLSGLTQKYKFSLYKKGILSLNDVQKNIDLTSQQSQQLHSELNKELYVDPILLSTFLQSLSYPLSFLDFEAAHHAIPPYPNMAVYEHLPFQYSLHTQDRQKQDPKHHEFIATPGQDPRLPLVNALLGHMPKTGSILVFNVGFEKKVLKQLAQTYPEHADALLDMSQRLVDLVPPFKQGAIYHHHMKGSFSLKSIMAALTSLPSYSKMAVSNGHHAARLYSTLHKEKNNDTLQTHLSDLRSYCALDTLAMATIIKVFQSLAD